MTAAKTALSDVLITSMALAAGISIPEHSDIAKVATVLAVSASGHVIKYAVGKARDARNGGAQGNADLFSRDEDEGDVPAGPPIGTAHTDTYIFDSSEDTPDD